VFVFADSWGVFLAVKKGFLAAVARRESPEVKHE
jgi:hypothetical protein